MEGKAMTKKLQDSADGVKDFAKAALTEIEKMEKGYIKTGDPISFVKKMFEGVIDPKPAEQAHVPFYVPPVIAPEWPKLKVLYGPPDYTAKEWLVAQNPQDELMYHAGGWMTRPMKELESLKAQGVKERPLADDERRRDPFKFANP
jgi:hypothetical protein